MVSYRSWGKRPDRTTKPLHNGEVSSPVIRSASVTDLAALQRIYRRASWSNEGDRLLLSAHPELLEFSDLAVREHRTWVATIGDQAVGFYSISTSSDSAELEDLFVDPDWMRIGIGTSLIEHAAGEVRAAGLSHLEVDANPHALQFYRHAGFVDCGSVELEHGTGVRMRRAARST
jgi:GNAT superfamily N-acetyltransferase